MCTFLCVPVCSCVFLCVCVCVPPLPAPYPTHTVGLNNRIPPHTLTWPPTPVPASVPESNCVTYPWEELPLKSAWNKRCFLNGVCQSGVFRGCSGCIRCVRTEGSKMLEKTGVFRHSLSLWRGLPLSQAEVRNLKNTVWKTPLVLRTPFKNPSQNPSENPLKPTARHLPRTLLRTFSKAVSRTLRTTLLRRRAVARRPGCAPYIEATVKWLKHDPKTSHFYVNPWWRQSCFSNRL